MYKIYGKGIDAMYNINPILDKRINRKHVEIAEILWDEPNDILSIENYINNRVISDHETDPESTTLDNLLCDLVLLNWVVIKRDLYCLTPYGRKILKNISDCCLN